MIKTMLNPSLFPSGWKALIAVLLISGCRSSEKGAVASETPTIVTTVLAAPSTGNAFEPTLAIDPVDPNRIVVGAMNGMPPVGVSSGIWTWRSTDGGRTWASSPLATPRFPGSDGPQSFGADVVAGFIDDGAYVLMSMSAVGDKMGTFVSRGSTGQDPAEAPAVPVYANTIDPKSGQAVMFDKPWLTVDRLEASAHRGTVYASSGVLVMEALPAKLGEPWKGPLVARIMLATSRDGGRTFSPPGLVSDSAFSGQLAVTPGGALEVTYARIVDKRGAANAVFHRRSLDGGGTFSPPTAVAQPAGDTLLDLPVLAARPNGDLLVCWSQGIRTDDQNNQVRCAHRPANGAWSQPTRVDPSLPMADVADAWPAIVGTERGWYLLDYLVRPNLTEVVLYRSADGVAFHRVATLATLAGLGAGTFCVNSVTPCRRSRPDGFTIGDYVALAASQGRLAAAYIVPRVLTPRPDSAAVNVSILQEPGSPLAAR